MTLPGKFDVGPSGAAHYSIPIAVPPGTAGMVPPLTLDYNSQASNGIVGIGWSLGGLPSIGRCAQTLAQDGVRGAVTYTPSDRFCLDGQRLIVISGAYGADSAEYRTEIESFTRVISHGTAGNGPAWFEVRTKSGQVMEFGHTADSQVPVQSGGTVRSWAVNKVSDTAGNYFKVTYSLDIGNGQTYPVRIDYTGNDAAGLAPNNYVQFAYANRSDVTPAYHAGSLFRVLYLLTDVKTYAGATLVADYKLGYQQGGAVPVNQLSSITLCGGDGACLPATTFQVISGGNGAFSDSTYFVPSGWNFGGAYDWTLIAGDFNGDGKSDFALLQGSVVHTFLSNGDGSFTGGTYVNPSGWNFGNPAGNTAQNESASGYSLIVGDFNGDGKTDFMLMGSNAQYVFLSNGDGSFSASSHVLPSGWVFGFPPTASWTLIVGDFDGDGRTDYALLQGTWVHTFLSNGDGSFTLGTYAIPNGWNFGSAPANEQRPGGNPTGSGFALVVGDFNGDGRTDFAMLTNNWAYTFLSNGDGTFAAVQSGIGSFGSPPNVNWMMIVGDFNGDGKTDFGFIGNSYIFTYLSRGDGTFQQGLYGIPNGWNFGSLPTTPFTPITGDFNGDGRTDLLMVGPTYQYVFLSNGDGSFTPLAWWTPYNFTSPPAAGWLPIVGDFNGDGKTDFALFQGTRGVFFLAAGQQSYQLTSLTTGLGATTTITYKPLTTSSAYTKDNNATYPVVDVQAPLYVVSRVDTSNGLGGTYSSTYRYAGAKSNLTGRGFLGFRQMVATDVQTNLVTTNNFRQDFPYIGLLASATKTLNAATLNQATNTYGSTPLGGTRSLVFLSQSVATSADLDGTAIPTVTTTYQYDAFGNATQVVVSTPDGYSKATTNTYTNDLTKWLLGRLTNATVTSTTP